ncbi:MAG: energy-coupling factor transporter transmembrane component T family protein [bacterium]
MFTLASGDRESIIHLLDPWTKLLIWFGMSGFIFTFESLPVFICLGMLLLMVAGMAGIPLLYMAGRLKYLLWFFIMGNLFYLFFTPGQVIYQLPWLGLTMTREGAVQAFITVLQLSLMTCAAFLVLQTTSQVKLAKSVQSIFYPLFRLGVPVPDISLMMIISLQFIPILLAEGKRIIQMQMMRKGESQEKKLLSYAGNLVPLVVPLILALVRRTQTLAMAIELRGYSGHIERHHFYLPRWHRRDVVAFLLAGLCMGGLMVGIEYF